MKICTLVTARNVIHILENILTQKLHTYFAILFVMFLFLIYFGHCSLFFFNVTTVLSEPLQ